MAGPFENWIDLLMLAILLASALIGVFRGLVFEVMSLLGWLVAWVGAQAGAAWLSPWIPFGVPGAPLRLGVAFVASFVLLLLGWRLLTWLVQAVVQATPLAPIDRGLGAAFGFLRGLVILLALVLLVGWTAMERAPAWQSSTGVRWMRLLHQALAPVLPTLPGVTTGSGGVPTGR